jgi:hypothetical protein
VGTEQDDAVLLNTGLVSAAECAVGEMGLLDNRVLGDGSGEALSFERLAIRVDKGAARDGFGLDAIGWSVVG